MPRIRGILRTLPVFLLTLLMLALLTTPTLAEPQSPDEEVRIAYYITITRENEPLLDRFLTRIYHPTNLYLIDYRPPLTPQKFKKVNIYTRQADPYTLHGISEVINVLDGMAFFLDRESYLSQDRSFEYFIHTSPDEYPLINSALMKRVLSFDHREYPPTNYFLFTDPSSWPLFSDEIDRFYMDLALSFNDSLDLSKGLIRSSLPHPDRYRRTMVLPRSDKHFVVNHEFVKQAVDSMLSKRLLLTLGDTIHVYEHFFAALAHNSKDPLGRIVKSTSLRCRDEKALQVEAHKLLPDYKPLPPTLDMLRNTTKPCLFTGPFDRSHSSALFDAIDHEFLIPPGTQGKEPGVGFHEKVMKMLKEIQS